MGVHLVPAPPEPLLTGAANLAALPSAASNRNVIAKTADGGAYISDGTTWQQISPPTGTYASLKEMAAVPDMLLTGTITRDTNGAATAASVAWPDGATGAYAGTASTAFPGAVDTYTITHILSGVTTTYTQPTVTRDSTTGAVTARPAITVT